MFMFRFVPLIAVLGIALAPTAFAAKKTPAPAPPAARQIPESDVDTSDSGSTEKGGAKSSARLTGTYSTLRSLGGDDDLIGVEVIIVRSAEGLRAFVQTADGIPAAPVLVPVKVEGTTLLFTIPSTTGQPLQFKGKATRQGLAGTLDDRPLTLPRRRSYWQ
jgi:hypothetical protein